MSFEEFQNRARLYVIGALESEDTEDFEAARKKYGQEAEDFIAECYNLHEAFALSLRPAKASDSIKERLMSMVKNREAK
jgi:pyruvate-formate lyase